MRRSWDDPKHPSAASYVRFVAFSYASAPNVGRQISFEGWILAEHAGDSTHATQPDMVGHEPASASDLDETLAQIWARSRSAIEEQLGSVEYAIECLSSGKLGHETRADAEREAHKLAGAVGAFGYGRAAEVAREIEQLLNGSGKIDPLSQQRLTDLGAELRSSLGLTEGG